MLSRAFPYLLAAMALVAQSAQTLQVVPLPRDGEVLVSFKLEETLTDEIRTAIQSGLTVKFVYRVELRRSSAAWFDRKIAEATVLAQVKYDTLTRQYHYSRAVDGRTQVADTTPSEQVAWSNLTQDFARLSLFRGASLEPNAEYYVRVTVNSSPRNSVFVWPWRADDAVGLGKFTFVR
jgi:hypothetical protein